MFQGYDKRLWCRQLKQNIYMYILYVHIIPEARIKFGPFVSPRVSFVRETSDLLGYSQTSRLETAAASAEIQ